MSATSGPRRWVVHAVRDGLQSSSDQHYPDAGEALSAVARLLQRGAVRVRVSRRRGGQTTVAEFVAGPRLVVLRRDRDGRMEAALAGLGYHLERVAS